MKIAMMVRGYLPVPRPLDMIYAPIDLAVAIAEGMVKRGHTVDFYAPTGSKLTGAKVKHLNMRPLATDNKQFQNLLNDKAQIDHYVPSLWDSYFVNEIFRQAIKGKYDVLHFHHPEVALPSAAVNADVPVVYTQHDPFYDWYRELYELYQTPSQHFVSISNNQRRDAPDLPYIKTIYNGIDINKFPFGKNHEDYLLFAGRIVPQKGVKEAVEIARRTGKRLLIIGPVYPDGQGYFDQYIKPFLDDKILYLGYMEQTQLVKYYQKAAAFLMPIQWEEPFGLTMVEAMACGTPVIALRRGAVPEVVEHGKTGFVVDSISEMEKAIGHLDQIDRRACREHVAEKFNIERVIDEYEIAYKKAIKKRKPRLTRNYIRSTIRRSVAP